jgi:hypothetical protein
MTDADPSHGLEGWMGLDCLPPEGPIQMLNLIRLKAVADYPPGHPDHGKAISGAEAYRTYGRLLGAAFAGRGAGRIWTGQPHTAVIGPPGETWDLAFIVEYPSAQAFLDMVRHPLYREDIGRHRTAAVADSRLLCLTPMPADGGPR